LVLKHVGGQVVADRACDECNVAIDRPGVADEPAICGVCDQPIREGEARYRDFEGHVHADCRKKAPPSRRRG
jgi:hypothetical protein